MSDVPPDAVLRAFGVAGRPVPLTGGQGTSWRVGGLVLKPAPDEATATLAWLRGVATSLLPAPVRLALPVPASDGRLRVDGWSATGWLDGATPRARWAERMEVARTLARAFLAADPAAVPAREDAWARADRMAWGEEDGPLLGHPLTRALAPVRAPVAVVHGDLAGNTLLHPRLPPAVIDLSLYARPVEWSVAVLVVDVVAFEGAPIDLLRAASPDPEFPQHLVRALLFRMITDELAGRPVDAAYQPLVDPVLALVR